MSSHSFRFFFPYFSNGCPPLHLSSSPSPSFIFNPIFSNPTSRSPSILAVHSPFLASLMFFHLSLPLSSLVCLYPSLPCGLPISPCFSPIFLLNCLLHHIFPQVVHPSFVNPLCSCYSTKPEPTFSCCCCSVNATVSRYRLRHACVTQALRTFLFSFFKMFLSNMTPSTFPQAFAPCCIRHRISTSECPSSLTIPPSYTKPSTWLNSLSSKLMFKSSL